MLVFYTRFLLVTSIHRQEKMERDLKQKRLLVEDYQKKLKQAHESEAAKDVRIVNIT